MEMLSSDSKTAPWYAVLVKVQNYRNLPNLVTVCLTLMYIVFDHCPRDWGSNPAREEM